MQPENDVFLFTEAEKQLFDSRRLTNPPCTTPEVIRYEMQFGKSRRHLRIERPTQEGLEYLVSHDGRECRTLFLHDCRLLRDLSPLGRLTGLEALRIEECRRLDQLWDMSGNTALRVLSIHGAKGLCASPLLLQTGRTLEEVRLWGPFPNGKYTLSSLECFRGLTALKRIDLNGIRLAERSLDVLTTLPSLEEFHFDAGMLSRRELEALHAAHPHLTGDVLNMFPD